MPKRLYRGKTFSLYLGPVPLIISPVCFAFLFSPLTIHRSSPIHLFAHSPAFLLFAASGCRFYCRLSLPFLVAVLQSKITVQYNIDVEGIGELKLVFRSSLFTDHCSLRSRCRFARSLRVCQTVEENNRSTTETQRNKQADGI